MFRPFEIAALAALIALPRPGAAQSQDPHDPAHREVDQIVVTASPLDRTSEELAVPVTILDREQVLLHLQPTLGETLSREPGITSTGFAFGASRPVIRGQEAVRVKVSENGIRAHDVSDLSPDHGVPVNPLTAQRVEIVRGPATVRYGGTAIGGVVNMLTNRVPRVLPERLSGEFYTEYGFRPSLRQGALVLEGGQGPLAVHLDAMRAESSDFQGGSGVNSGLSNSDVEGWSYAAGASLFGDPGRIGLAVGRFGNEYGSPGEETFIDLDKTFAQFELDWEAEALPGISSVRFRGANSDYEHDEVVIGEGVASTFENSEIEGRIEFVHEPLLGLNGAFGVHMRQRDFEAGGEGEEFLDPTDTDTWAVFLFEELVLSQRLRLQLGLRQEWTSLAGRDASGTRRTPEFQPYSASLGVVFDPRDTLSIGLTLSAVQRAPAVIELFASGPHEATQTFETGDPGIDEERSISADLVVRGNWGRVSGELAGFYLDYSNYIFGQKTGNTCDEMGMCIAGPGEELDELIYLEDDATFYGGEARANVELFELLGGHVGIDAQLDVVRGRLDNGNVPRQPPMRYGTGLHFSHDRLSARVGFLRHRKQRRNADFETETGAYTSWDAQATVRLLEQGERALDLSVIGSNLTNERGRNAVNIRKDEVPVSGRLIRVALRGSF